METIINNPFRILGLPITATDREITKRVDDLSMFCEMGKTKQYDTDFAFMSPLQRTPDLIQRAASQIELPKQRLFHSIFWFWPGNSVDELVFELLKDGNAQKARELWEKPVKDSTLSAKNFPNYRNLALLYMILSVKPGNVNLSIFLDAVRLYLKTFNHDSFLGFLQMAGGPTFKISTEEIQKYFADEAHKVIIAIDRQENPTDTAKRYIVAFNGSTSGVIQHVRGKFISKHLHQLESAIEECQKIREKKTSDIHVAAKSLYSTAKGILIIIEEILTKQDLHYQHIADNVAKELLCCSTAHFNVMIVDDDSLTPIDQSEQITLWARDIAAGSSVLAEINKDLLQIKDIREQKVKDAKDEPIQKLGEEIVEEITKLPKVENLNGNVLKQLPQALESFISNSKNHLYSIKQIGGAEHEGYLALSELVVRVVLGMSIAYANRTNNYQVVIKFLNDIKTLYMKPDLRANFVTNYEILKNNLEMKKSSSGCYIATLVYGSYEAPEVLMLRQLRDEVLARSFVGRLFVRVYYKISPSLVIFLKNQVKIQSFIRQLLDILIRKISQ